MEHKRPDDDIGTWEDVPNDGALRMVAEAVEVGLEPLTESARQILILPSNNRLTQKTRDYNAFAETSKDLTARLREAGLDAGLLEDGKERKELLLKSDDVILPVLLFLCTAPAQVAFNILASWIYDKWIKTDAKSPRTIKFEYIELNDKKRISRWRKVQGAAAQVRRLLLQEARTEGRAQKEPLHKGLKPPPPTPRSSPGLAWSKRTRREARAALANARELIKQAEAAWLGQEGEAAERNYRQSLEKIREAVLWEPQNKAYRQYLHRVGGKVHNLFGCRIEFKEGKYSVSCPVMLSHSKGGFSIGGTGTVICSICGENVLNCPHERGHVYDAVVARLLFGKCNICGEEHCGHAEGESFDGVEACGVITDLDLDHVAYVESPANPMCAIKGYSLTKADIMNEFPEMERSAFVYGLTHLHCHHCCVCKG